MLFKDLMNRFDNWNVIVCINNKSCLPVLKMTAWQLMELRKDLYEAEVIAFGFYEGELCVRLNI